MKYGKVEFGVLDKRVNRFIAEVYWAVESVALIYFHRLKVFFQ